MMNCATAGQPPSDDGWAVEPKFDGARIAATRGGSRLPGGFDDRHPVQIETRTGNRHDGKFPLIEAAIEALPPGTVLDGELIWGTGKDGWGHVQSALGGRAACSNPGIKYVVFDVLRFGGIRVEHAPYHDRRELLVRMTEEFWEKNPIAAGVALAPSWLLSSHVTIPDMLVTMLGYEGAVFKRLDSPYRAVERHPDWMKWKPQQTADVVIRALPHDGKGKYEGMVGAIEFVAADGAEGRCSGMSDDLRQRMTQSPDAYLGTVIEIKHHGKLDSGKYRHPQFSRLRPDKTPAQID